MKTTAIKTAALLLLAALSCYANADDTQDLRNIYNSLLPDFQNLTPEASALGQYGKYNNSGYTGVPNISVPLFDICSGDFTMPVELCYDASGIKVDQQATYVGLGWNMVMGGSISQIVCGKNDFNQNSFSINPSSITNLDLLQTVLPGIGYTPYYCIAGLPLVRFPSVPANPSLFCQPIEEDRKKFDILRDVSDGVRVPDIFQASFCGHRVSFVIDTGSKEARIIGNDATAYRIELKDYTGSYPHSIEITDDHGQMYVFAEAPKTSMEDNASYNLAEIRNAAGRCLAEFKYPEKGYSLLQSYYETVGKRDENSDMPIASEAIREIFIKRNQPSTLVYGIREYYPDTIITDKETVTFAYGSREDIKFAKRIDSITVRSSDNGTILHTVAFAYGYHTESEYEHTLCSKYGYTNVYGFKRLKLTDVTVDGKKYSFGYNDAQELPSRISMRQDFWGYYNGKTNADGLCASPEYKYDYDGRLTGIETVGPANRYANELYCKIGTLNQITYPTGGFTLFEYEINHFDDEHGKYYYPSASSSVKIPRTVTCGTGYNGTGYNNTPETRDFDIDQAVPVEISSGSSYLPSPQQYYKLDLGIVGKDSTGQTVFSRYYTKYNDMEDFKESCVLPKGHYVLSCKFSTVASGLITGGRIQVTLPPAYVEDTSIADASGKSVGGGLRIRTVENYDSDGEMLGYTRYRYEEGKLLIPTVDKEHIDMQYLFASKPANPCFYSIPSTLYCAFYFITSDPKYLAVCSLECPDVGYSKVTKENYDKDGQLMSYSTENFHNDGCHSVNNGIFGVNTDGLNGKLTESATFSSDSVLMHKICYSYTVIGGSPALSDMVFFPWARCSDMSPGSSALDVYYKYALISKSPLCALPSSVTETGYVDGVAMKPVTTTYEYNENNYMPSSITKSVAFNANTEETCLTRYWYPGDAEAVNSNTACLTSAHCISERVKALQYRNGNTVGGYRNLYMPLSNGLPVVSKNYSITPNNSEVLELDVTDYDDYGNICGYKKKDGTPVAVIWSYCHRLPVLEIVGKAYSEVKAMSGIVDILENGTAATEITNATESLHAALLNERAMATAYEYSPWHTLSCVIKPNGDKAKYRYDTYGRLEEARDADDNILQKYNYNYKTN